MADTSEQALEQSDQALDYRTPEITRLESMQDALALFLEGRKNKVDVTGADATIKSAILDIWRVDLDEEIAYGKPYRTEDRDGGIDHGGVTYDMVTPKVPSFVVVLKFTDRGGYDTRKPASVFLVK